MFRASKFRLCIVAALVIAIAVYILNNIGLKAILSAAMSVGWRGFAILYLYQLALFVLLGIAWYVLIPASLNARAIVFIWARMVRDATSELLPLSHLGGIVLGARSSISPDVPQSIALASTMVDVATEFVAQIVYITCGVVIWSATTHNSVAFFVATAVVLGLLMIALIVAAFLAFQRYGKRLATNMAVRLFPRAATATEAAANAIHKIIRRRGSVGLSFSIHIAGWAASGLSTWIALLLMGVHVQVSSVLAIEGLVCAARSMAFLVPNAFGIQEVAYAAVAPLFGIGAEIGVAISLLKRARDIAVDVPILLRWQWMESRRFLVLSAPRAEATNGSG